MLVSVLILMNAVRGSHDCDANATCVDKDPLVSDPETGKAQSYSCECNEGFYGDGKFCTENPVTKPCGDGYTGDLVWDESKKSWDTSACVNVDQCTASSPLTCDEGKVCKDIDGPDICVEAKINECGAGSPGDPDYVEASHDCHRNAVCGDTDEAYACTCKDNYLGDGKIACNLIGFNYTDPSSPSQNEKDCGDGFTGKASWVGDHWDTSSCVADKGSTTAPSCPEGYTGSNTADWDDAGSKWTITCTDINQCNGDQAIDCSADENSECVNKEGLDSCECKSGYYFDGNKCVNINECGIGQEGDASYFAPSHDCDQNASCLDSIGGLHVLVTLIILETEKTVRQSTVKIKLAVE